jgi:hypothetical protein
MKMKLLVGIIAAAVTMGLTIRAEEAAHKSCCEKAKDKGEACKHPCCVKAKEEGKTCEKCNPPKEAAK